METAADATLRVLATHPSAETALARQQSFYVQFEVRNPAAVSVTIEAFYKEQPVSASMASSAAVRVQAGGGSFFGTFLILALAGTVLMDRRKAATLGDAGRNFAAVTSNLPFAAIISGRNQLLPGEIGWWKAVIGIALYFVLLRYHAVLFGVRPLI